MGITIPIIILLIFVVIGAVRNLPQPTYNEFFFMNRSATPSEYSDTTVGYSLQVAVTIYFVFFGYKYGWDNVFFIISWCIGFVLFALAMPTLAPILRKQPTMMGILAAENNILRNLSKFLLIVSLAGLIYSELFFSAQFLSNAAVAAGSGLK